MSKILVIGGAGRIGSIAASALSDDGHTVVVWDKYTHAVDSRSSINLASAAIRNCDATHRNEWRHLKSDFDVIVHALGLEDERMNDPYVSMGTFVGAAYMMVDTWPDAQHVLFRSVTSGSSRASKPAFASAERWAAKYLGTELPTDQFCSVFLPPIVGYSGGWEEDVIETAHGRSALTMYEFGRGKSVYSTEEAVRAAIVHAVSHNPTGVLVDGPELSDSELISFVESSFGRNLTTRIYQEPYENSHFRCSKDATDLCRSQVSVEKTATDEQVYSALEGLR